ncbi:hypothetical protein C8Q79DRAFT_976024, partial [Trametes meyenii]
MRLSGGAPLEDSTRNKSVMDPGLLLGSKGAYETVHCWSRASRQLEDEHVNHPDPFPQRTRYGCGRIDVLGGTAGDFYMRWDTHGTLSEGVWHERPRPKVRRVRLEKPALVLWPLMFLGRGCRMRPRARFCMKEETPRVTFRARPWPLVETSCRLRAAGCCTSRRGISEESPGRGLMGDDGSGARTRAWVGRRCAERRVAGAESGWDDNGQGAYM